MKRINLSLTLLVYMLLAGLQLPAHAQDNDSDNYRINWSPLVDVPYQMLPLGNVKAEGWLQVQLRRQAEGLTGKLVAQETRLQIAGQPVEVNLQFVSDYTVRVTFLPIRVNGTTEEVTGYPMLRDDLRYRPEYQSRKFKPDEDVELTQNKMHVKMRGERLTVLLNKQETQNTQHFHIDTASGNFTTTAGETPLFGLGQGAQQFDRRGAFYPMEIGSRHWSMKEYGGRMPVPWVISPEGWSVFFHRPAGSIDLRNGEIKFTPWKTRKAVPLDFFISLAETPSELFKEYGKITGYPPMPPKWSLGYLQSHRTLAGPHEVLNVAETFRRKQLPCDALIYLGTGWCPAGWNRGHGSISFNPKIFPTPGGLIKELQDLNFRTVFHVVFPPEDLYGRVNSRNVSPVDSSHATNYWKRHVPVMELGGNGWWPDAGEKLSLNSRTARIRMYYDGIRQDYNERPFALHRTGFAGMQRYGAWIWSGDVYSTWEQLRNQVPLGLNAGVSGLPYWGTDIGGFWTTEELTGELYVRWFQFGAFSPLFRSHGRTWHTRLPWGWNTGDPGPIEATENPPGQGVPDSSELHNSRVEPICRTYLDLRYQLMPYTYTLAYEASKSGLPFMRPLWMYYSDREAGQVQDQFLWGRDILVAPVIRKGATSREVYLPEGGWYDYWTQEKISGGREVTKQVDLSTMPIYVRAGAVIPMGPKIQHTGQSQYGPLTVYIFPGKDGEFTLYEDDGLSLDHLQGEYMKTEFHWDDGNTLLTIKPKNTLNLLPNNQRQITVRVVSKDLEKQVKYHGEPLEIHMSSK